LSTTANRASRATRQRGLTLIELLVVIIILTTLVSAAIPLLSPTNDDRRLREASRGVNSFISAAQMKAIQLQRPFGVAIKRLAQDTGNAADNAVSLELYYVEQPTPYRGFDDTSAVRVAIYTPANSTLYGGGPFVLIQFVARGNSNDKSQDGLPNGWDADQFPGGVVRPGDVLEMNGTRYELLFNASDNGIESRVTNGFYDYNTGKANDDPKKVSQIVGRPLNDTGQMINVKYDDRGDALANVTAARPPYFTYPSPYKILRQPMMASGEPFQLPDGTAIDLRASGQAIEIGSSGANGFFYNPDDPIAANCVNNADPIVIMFTPEGAIERVRLNQKNVAGANVDNIFDGKTVSNLFLLIGRRAIAPPPVTGNDKTLDPSNYDSTPSLPTDEQKQSYKEAVNWLRGESRWIVIGAQSGRVVTVGNSFVDPTQFFDTTTYPSDTLDVRRARQIHAAREFAREMTQIGGK
jgi:prepilin-type N-terminal cleavage/methylation domain-containing protein